MSGIFGWWHLDRRPAHAPDVIASSNPASFGQIACVLEGRLDNGAELRRLLKDHPLVSAECPNSPLVLAAYDRFGEAFVEHLEGDFVVSVFDGRMNRLLLARDRLGLRPLCYAQVGQTLLFASDAKALLDYPGMKAAPDEATLAEFVLYFPSAESQTRTFFQGVQSLSPAHLLVATPARLSLRRYFEFDTSRRLRFPAFRDYTNAFHDLFVASVRNRLRSGSPVAISVSGGLDSSYIFCVAQRLMRDEPGLCPAVLGFNYGGPPGSPSDERHFLRHLEEACGVTIEHIAQRPGFMECAGEEVWYSESPSVEGLARLQHAVLHRVHEAGARRFVSGHWGDQVLSDSDYLLDLLRSGRWPLLGRHRKRWGISAPRLAIRFARDLIERHAPRSLSSAMRHARGHLDGPWKSPWFTPRFRRILLERFTAERLPRRAGTSHAWSMYQQTRRGHDLRCMEWNNRMGAMHGLEIAFPYLDCELIQFLMSIPGEVQSHDGVPRGLMREAMRSIVPDAIIARRSKGEFTSLANEGIEYDFAAVRELLGPDALSVRFGYLDGGVLRNALDQWRMAIRTTDEAILADRILGLCGLELFLRRFFPTSEHQTTARPEARTA